MHRNSCKDYLLFSNNSKSPNYNNLTSFKRRNTCLNYGMNQYHSSNYQRHSSSHQFFYTTDNNLDSREKLFREGNISAS